MARFGSLLGVGGDRRSLLLGTVLGDSRGCWWLSMTFSPADGPEQQKVA